MGRKVVLDRSSPPVKYLENKDERLAKIISRVGIIEYNVYDDGYAFLVHEIIEQMLSVSVANKIYNRLLELCDGTITPETINRLTDLQIKSIGTSKSKVSYIRALTDAIISGNLVLSELENMSEKEATTRLIGIKGIGSWTAKMYMIFVLDKNDILPYEDAAFKQVFKWIYNTNDDSKESIEERCEIWKPYSSTAARYFYRALDMGLTSSFV